MKVIAQVTSGQLQMKHYAYYCFGALLFENFRTVKYIVQKRIDDLCVRNELTENIDAVSDFLKHGYLNHVDSDSDCVHDRKRALIGEALSTEGCRNVGNTGLSEGTALQSSG